ncbi:hypothetical protein LP419_17055 [Massilia sp. H-1]|nr:hypothetical protein LP419_17055 [Massilia sp. H-1]
MSESGQAYTWSENAHEFRLTPWDNDPVSDRGGEAFYIRDEQTGKFWSPTALPVPASGESVTRHGFGYSVFEHSEEGIFSELCTFVALDAAIKYSVIKLRNDSTVPRRLSATGYVEWVLGDLRHKTGMHVTTELDPVSGALFARNQYNTEFFGRVGFFHVEAQNRTITSDRTEFIGRNRTLASPAAMGARACRANWAPRSTRARRSRSCSNCSRAKSASWCSCWAWAGAAMPTPAAWSSSTTAARRPRRPSTRCAITGRTRWARSRCTRPTLRST